MTLSQQIINYANQYAPHEMCGFIILKGNESVFLLCENQAKDKENYFEISPEDFLRANSQGKITALVHSHPNGEPVLSILDRQTQLAVDLDFWLVCGNEIYIFPKIPPLLGRKFDHGVMDCYTLFRDFYYLSGVDFPNFERNEYWWKEGDNLYLDNMATYGFEQLADESAVQVGDVILMQVGADVPNHAAIYIGDQMVLHHSPKRLSKRDLYDGYWLKHTHSIWRYKAWQQLDFTVILNDLAINSILR